MILPALHAYTATGHTWFVQVHIGSAIADGYWHADTGEVRGPSICVFGSDPTRIVARFPIVADTKKRVAA